MSLPPKKLAAPVISLGLGNLQKSILTRQINKFSNLLVWDSCRESGRGSDSSSFESSGGKTEQARGKTEGQTEGEAEKGGGGERTEGGGNLPKTSMDHRWLDRSSLEHCFWLQSKSVMDPWWLKATLKAIEPLAKEVERFFRNSSTHLLTSMGFENYELYQRQFFFNSIGSPLVWGSTFYKDFHWVSGHAVNFSVIPSCPLLKTLPQCYKTTFVTLNSAGILTRI